ncbi:MAG: bifunctional (p)ppGpp synthetase/guanosine-3',5'-bis(diphosphate) 3'-pyrophosphohydrolase [Chthonomonadales bacterium]|nr:bifunctional (p)ppGpp synthetase/guanosine-3',5'-bis(diphosphate) 3'-pyrophosphohydrolase [Chthonomonadales bacterium]
MTGNDDRSSDHQRTTAAVDEHASEMSLASIPNDKLIEDAYAALEASIVALRPEADLQRIRSAYIFARDAHQSHRRKSGLPYITHPIAVAQVVVDLKLDDVAIIAALLHDIIEMTPFTVDDIRSRFTDEVAVIVDGLTKIEKLVFEYNARNPYAEEETEPREEEPGEDDRRRTRPVKSATRAANLRRFFFAIAKDLRVILVKLADRLHNMRTLQSKPSADQRRIAVETLQIFAPLAHRLGIWQIKWELEDLAFRYSEPEEYQRVANLVAQTRAQRQTEVDEAIQLIQEHLLARGLTRALVIGRAKHLYSIYNKMRNQGVEFQSIYDLIALRVIVDRREQCYEALGYIGEVWPTVPNTYADYISIPKSNLYQSIHLKVIGPRNRPIEIQIRTREMHRTAEYGMAAHWAYKEQGEGGRAESDADRRIAQFTREFHELSDEATDPNSFLSQLLQELFSDKVMVFTPMGEPYDLPIGSTVIDFAYRIHSDIGHHAIGARVHGTFRPLDYILQNGDWIEVVTRSNTSPSPDWLRFAKTTQARAKIKAYFRKETYEADVEKGRALLLAEASKAGLDRDRTRDDLLTEAAIAMGYQTVRDLLAALGNKTASIQTILRHLAPALPPRPEPAPLPDSAEPPEDTGTVITMGSETNVAYRRSRCCLPLPGEEVWAYVSRGSGLLIHRADCPNLKKLAEAEPERVLKIAYKAGIGNPLSVILRVHCHDRAGLLSDVSGVITDSRVNITGVRTQTHRNGTATLQYTVAVPDIEGLNRLIEHLQRLPDTIRVERPFSGGGSSR